ncbi:protein HID1 [Teleopsis dalmanni]|uniref:protein HID1-like n=1 Tax=Teleopsis dalmanni TaxID=139649 RepID=UPI0018CD0EDB|nr:protein HID1-like [Teleopsis dalmanni]XP_037947421.1 protein HID1 [Teleopsis dalmanni]
MGNTDSKLNFRKAIVQLTQKNQKIDASDEQFWDQFWNGHQTSLEDVFVLVTAAEIRNLRTDNPANLATLCYKAVEKLALAVDSSCRTQSEQQCVLNCVRLLIRLLPYIFEDDKWHDFFWSSLPAQESSNRRDIERDQFSISASQNVPLAQSLLNAICDLLFCPDFTVTAARRAGPDKVDELANIDSCEYIWEAGVGFAQSPPKMAHMEKRRTELLKLLLTCFSEPMYRTPQQSGEPNRWIAYFTSADNRHALPLFTSFLNTVCAYDPVGFGVPYNHLIFVDTTEPLVEACLQILIVTLDHDMIIHQQQQLELHRQLQGGAGAAAVAPYDDGFGDNLFINYLSRVHRDEDFHFVLKGITRLLNNPLVQNYLPNSTKRLHCHQELLILFWKICDYNKKFLYFVLKSSDVLDILIPILYHLNYSRADQSRVGLMHIGVFILLLLSGERNFGVRLNKPYTATVPMDIPVFTGTHADLLITVFHKIIATGHQRLQPLFDCLLTILVNVSPYLKTLSMVASVKLLHLLEAFSTPWFLLSAPSNHHLVFFLLEIFNNIIQYQFDGNSNLVYTIIRKRHVFHAMANLPSDMTGIAKCLSGRKIGKFNLPPVAQHKMSTITKHFPSQVPEEDDIEVEDDEHESEAEENDRKNDKPIDGTLAALPAEPGTLKASLLETPDINQMTERERAHPGSTDSTPTVDGTSDIVQYKNNSEKSPSESRTSSPNGSVVASSPHSNRKSTIPKENQSRLSVSHRGSIRMVPAGQERWTPTPEWIVSWRSKLPLQTIMRLLQVLVPQVEKICIDKGLTDESEILKFLQHGTLVGLLPVPHPILIRKYQANAGTTAWFRTYIWGVIYLRNVEPAIWYDTEVKLFEIQRV